MPNHLLGQTSPYLLQHLHNPVDWYPWSEEALSRARSEDKPIFLSIGYAACHWCHVMERESFENDDVAAFLNRHFVAIKVDREERPDIDEIYMNAVQLMTGQGGWPLSVFLTPDLEPFRGGTYFPPEDRYGRIGFRAVLQRVHDAWVERRDDIRQSAGQMIGHLQEIARGGGGGGDTGGRIGAGEAARAAAELAGRFDPANGGFGPAPKFPPDGALALLLREHARAGEEVPLRMARRTLDAMALGGMYDQIGGGFARYSVDARWLVPHFEKMLYNQALLVPVYVDGFQITGSPLYRRVIEETLDFVRREMTGAEGGFHSSLDADSEGEEGKFYVWSADEVTSVLGPDDGGFFRSVYGVRPSGNFEGRNIPNLLDASLAERAARDGTTEQALVDRLRPSRLALLDARERRVRPASDDKILTAWNGLMIGALARAHQALGRPEDLAAARAAAEFLEREVWNDGRLLATWRHGRARLNAYVDDYAFLGRGLVDLYEADFDERWLRWSEEIARTLVARFEDREIGGFFFTSDDHETLPVRNRSLHDGALPSGYGVASELLLRLAMHRNNAGMRDTAERALVAARAAAARAPSAFASILRAAALAEGPWREVAIVGSRNDPATEALLREIRRRYLPGLVVQSVERAVTGGRLALLRDKTPQDATPTAWVCTGYACREPTSDPSELARQLD